MCYFFPEHIVHGEMGHLMQLSTHMSCGVFSRLKGRFHRIQNISMYKRRLTQVHLQNFVCNTVEYCCIYYFYISCES